MVKNFLIRPWGVNPINPPRYATAEVHRNTAPSSLAYSMTLHTGSLILSGWMLQLCSRCEWCYYAATQRSDRVAV